MRQVSILGCGWLGTPLAIELLKNDYLIKGATTQFEKLEILRADGVVPFQILVLPEGIKGDIKSFLDQSEILVINIPPNRKEEAAASYFRKMKQVIPFIEASTVNKVLLVSSTSVFQDAENFPVYTEHELPNAISPFAKNLINVERLFFQNEKFKTSIVRFGGLIGKKRHPIYHLSSKKGILNPEAPINLIVLDDCIEILKQIIQQNAWHEQFNAVFPEHPPKAEYYTQKAAEFELKAPVFEYEKSSIGKVVTSQYLMDTLGFRFNHLV